MDSLKVIFLRALRVQVKAYSEAQPLALDH
jgi:hypothetical protein